MKKNLINSLLLDTSNLLAYVNTTDDLLVLELFVNLLLSLKKECINQECGIK